MRSGGRTVRLLGAGVNLLPNTVREWAALGLLKGLSWCAVATAELRYHHRGGALIVVGPRRLAAGYRWPQLSIHRDALHTVLLGAVRERVGGRDRCAAGPQVVVGGGPGGIGAGCSGVRRS